MKIVEIIPALTCGGAERFVVDLCNELGQTHDVTLLTVFQFRSEDFLQRQLSSDVRLICLGKKTGLAGALASLWPIWLFLRRERPEVVHTHLGGLAMIFPALVTGIGGGRFFHTVHSDAYLEAQTHSRLLFRRFLFRRGLVVPVAISPESAQSFVDAYGFPAQMIQNGCSVAEAPEEAKKNAENEMSAWRSCPESTVFLNLARMVPQKNQLALARAVQKLVEEGEKLDLVIMGAEIDREIKEAITALRCPNIHLAGVREYPLPYLALADAFCLPSLVEGLPISLLESAALGIPACVSAVGGMINVVKDGENGLLATDTGVEGIAELLRRFLRMLPEKRHQMGEEARSAFVPYSMSRCAAAYLQIMENLR